MKNIAGQQLLGLEAEQKTLLVHLDTLFNITLCRKQHNYYL
jgi:hypothetical protein